MAIIKMTSGKAYVGKLEKYLKDPEKTKEHLQTGLNCDIKHLSYEFRETKAMYKKTAGRRYYHLVQSFSNKEDITPDKAHEIGVKLAEKQFANKGYEVGVITHTDKFHTHNHIVINSVNARTGKKFKSKAKDLWRIKDYSNELVKAYDLKYSLVNHLERTNNIVYDRGEYESYKRGNSWKADTILDIKKTLKEEPTSMNDFIDKLEDKGYGVKYSKTSKTMTFTTPQGKKVRGRTLTKSYEDIDYSKGALENEIQRFRKLSREKTYEQRNFKNERTYGTDEKLHQRSNGQGYDKENELGKGTSGHQKRIDRDTKPNDFDIEKAREFVESEQQSTAKDFGKWSDKLEREHEQGLDGNAIDRERVKQRNREIERAKQESLEISRARDIGPSL